MSTVRLRPVGEAELPGLLAVAVADCGPGDVMPAGAAPAGWTWTPERRDAFLDHHRSPGGATYAIEVDGEIAGAVRLAPGGAPGLLETGVWLVRSARGKGYGTEALHLVVVEARSRGAQALVAETSAANEAAVGALRKLGAKLWEDPDSGAVHATLRV